MTHIVHVVDLLDVGGAQSLISCFAREATRQGIGVSVISLSAVEGSIPAGELAEIGVPLAVFPARHLASAGRMAALVRYLRSQKFDLVHTHLSYGNILGGLAGRLAGLPVIATLHSAGNDQSPASLEDFSSLRGRAETFALRHWATGVMAVGESVARVQRVRLGGKPIEVIPNAAPRPALISAEERRARREQILGAGQGPLLVSVGRFAVVKELPDLVTAFSQVKAGHPGAKLALIGDGSERERVESLVHSLGLEQDVLLTGRREDVSAWLQASDLYVSASSLEGLPLSILEAMAVGLPVVATAVGDVPGLVGPESGRLAPPHQPQRLAEAIGALLDQPEQLKAMGKAAQAVVARDYDVATWFQRILGLYAGVLGKSAADLIAGRGEV